MEILFKSFKRWNITRDSNDGKLIYNINSINKRGGSIIARYNFGEKTKSFSEFKLEIEETIFDQEITEITIDPNILSLYEELLKLKEHLEKFTINFVTNSEIDEILEEVFENGQEKNVN